MKTSIMLLAVLFSALTSHAFGDTFGSGANAFDIQFVTIGNPGNAADDTGKPNPAGSVPYIYRMGTYEISRDMIVKANTLGNLAITLADMTSFGGNGADRPATGMSWNEAARFVNWLNTSTGSPPAYKFALQPGDVGYGVNANIQLWTPSDAGYDANNLYRNSLATYFLPSVHEWYKAAYYNPTSGVYYDYPTGSDIAPTSVTSGTSAGTAVYGQTNATGPANITLAGGLSPYGTMAQGGNVYEWDETASNLLNDSISSARGVRSGAWTSSPNMMLASIRNADSPTVQDSNGGFRVASKLIAGIAGDYSGNGAVDAADYALWRKGGPLQNEVDTPGTVNAADYTAWRQRFGDPNPGSGSGLDAAAVPEPATLVLTIAGIAGLLARRRKSVPHNRV